MLDLVAEDDVENPIEAQDWIDGHCHVIVPSFLVAENLPQEMMFSIGVAKT